MGGQLANLGGELGQFALVGGLQFTHRVSPLEQIREPFACGQLPFPQNRGSNPSFSGELIEGFGLLQQL